MKNDYNNIKFLPCILLKISWVYVVKEHIWPATMGSRNRKNNINYLINYI